MRARLASDTQPQLPTTRHSTCWSLSAMRSSSAATVSSGYLRGSIVPSMTTRGMPSRSGFGGGPVRSEP